MAGNFGLCRLSLSLRFRLGDFPVIGLAVDDAFGPELVHADEDAEDFEDGEEEFFGFGHCDGGG